MYKEETKHEFMTYKLLIHLAKSHGEKSFCLTEENSK